MSSRIENCFRALKQSQHIAFMPFITAGDPDLQLTQSLIGELADRGVDLIEVGFPYSDPIADGPVIQSSYTRALEQQIHVREIFSAVGELDTQSLPPLVAMVSYAIIFRIGAENFVAQAAQAGFSGLIVPDLPGDEAAEFFQVVRARNLDLIQLVAPTTPRDRVKQILKSCSGFVYCIAVSGTTGVREQVADELLAQLRWLREETDLPLCVGFGISQPEHIDPLRDLADGAIVGSGIVRHLQDLADGKSDRDSVIKTIGNFAARMSTTCHSE